MRPTSFGPKEVSLCSICPLACLFFLPGLLSPAPLFPLRFFFTLPMLVQVVLGSCELGLWHNGPSACVAWFVQALLSIFCLCLTILAHPAPLLLFLSICLR